MSRTLAAILTDDIIEVFVLNQRMKFTMPWIDALANLTVGLGLIVIVIVNSKFLKRHCKAKRGAPAYSRALRYVKRGSPKRVVRGGPISISR